MITGNRSISPAGRRAVCPSVCEPQREYSLWGFLNCRKGAVPEKLDSVLWSGSVSGILGVTFWMRRLRARKKQRGGDVCSLPI